MAKDAELDRLKMAQEQAFQRKQRAYDSMQRAWDVRVRARDDMNHAYESKQSAYEAQDRSWQHYQQIRNTNGPRIDSLNAQQERAYINMRQAFENASAAYERRDGASAKSYAGSGHQYRAESSRHVDERRYLVNEIRSAKADHEATKPAFQNAKGNFDRARNIFVTAKAAHERAQVNFKQAKAEFTRTTEAFQARLQTVKAEQQKRRDDKRAIAEKAGVPLQYLDNVWVSKDSSGNINIYFGGDGGADGPGHGHYVLDSSDNVTYRRNPFDPHGTHNFTDQDVVLYDRGARSEKDPIGAQGVFARRDGKPGHTTQYYDDKYRLSSDIEDDTIARQHWTNQNVGKNHPDRHEPPPDAR